MNQILVTRKVYVTPELRRKGKILKFEFFLCIFLACLLFSYYIYAEYDREKSEEVSQQILLGLNKEKIVDNTIKQKDDIIVIALEDNEEPNEIITPIINISKNGPMTINYETEDGISYNVESILRIPRLEINYPVITDTSEELLKVSLNKYWGPSPNEVGNYCVVGHNYKSKKMFGKLSEIENGDIVEIEDLRGNVVKYSVYDRYSVQPDDTSCTSQLTAGRKEVTLITCTNYGTQRLVVKAREIK